MMGRAAGSGRWRALVAAALLPAAAVAQDAAPAGDAVPADPAPIRVPAPMSGAALAQAIITVDQETLFRDSAWGLRAVRMLADRTREISADNDRLFAQLSSEEAALTESRKTLSPEEFRKRAAAFDDRVSRMRREREAAANELQQLADAERAAFFRAATPVIGALMRERGALVVLDPRTVLFSVESIDVTRDVIARLDAEIGDGAGVVDAAAAKQEAAPKTVDAPSGTANPSGAANPPVADGRPAPSAGAGN